MRSSLGAYIIYYVKFFSLMFSRGYASKHVVLRIMYIMLNSPEFRPAGVYWTPVSGFRLTFPAGGSTVDPLCWF